MTATVTLDEFLASPPNLHGTTTKNYLGLHEIVLRWLVKNVDPSSTTLETGCGASTIAFAMLGTRHTVISPFVEEHESIKAWCAENGVATGQIRFIAACSETVLPSLDVEPLDLVLIDGNHSFPIPVVDWFYTADKLKKGGRMVVDDLHIRPCAVLRDFMAAEAGRWEKEIEFFRTAVFKKLSDKAGVAEAWSLQPWSANPWSVKERVKNLVKEVSRVTIGRSPRLKKAAYELHHAIFSNGSAKKS